MLRTRRLGLLAAAAMLACLPIHAFAQQGGLRGGVEEEDVNRDLLFGRVPLDRRSTPLSPAQPAAPANAAATPYIPASPGAVPDEASAEDPSLFGASGEASQNDGTAGLTPTPRPPSTARQRREGSGEAEEAPTGAEVQPPEADLTTGGLRAAPVDVEDLRRIERIAPIEGREREPEEDPYAPLGLRVGSFNVVTSLESGLRASSNADLSPNGEDGVLSESTLRLNAVSDWSRHRAALDAYGIVRQSLSGADIDEKEAGVSALLDFEITDALRAEAAAAYRIRPESASSPVVIEGTVSRPTRQTLTGSLGIEKDAGKLRFGLNGNVERDWFGDAELSTGETLSQSERNSTLATIVLRGGYEISPALVPFVEVEAGRRFYDEEVDSAGYARSADRLGARAGVELDLGEKLRGEFAAGWLQETPEDSRLDSVSGPSVNANLTWSPVRGTNVILSGQTTVEGTTTPGESGSILYTGRLGIDREIRANLTGNATLGAEWRDYVGVDAHDLILSAELGATYWLNRYAGLVGRARHERLQSDLPGRDYDANSVFLGIRLQR